MKKPPTVKATTTKPKAPKPRKRPKKYGVTWYDIRLEVWQCGFFSTDKHENDDLVAELMRGGDDADPASVRVVVIEGE